MILPGTDTSQEVYSRYLTILSHSGLAYCFHYQDVVTSFSGIAVNVSKPGRIQAEIQMQVYANPSRSCIASHLFAGI